MIASEARRQEIEQEVRVQGRDGDMLFRYSAAKHYHVIPFSWLMLKLCKSRWSHTAVLHIDEDGDLWVFDMSGKDGMVCIPFRVWMLRTHHRGKIGLRRVHPEWEYLLPKVIEHCRVQVSRRPNYDKKFILGDDALYCTEATQESYRVPGVPMRVPDRLDQLPGWNCLFALFGIIGGIDTTNSIYSPGNEDYGLWSEPSFMTVRDDKAGTP